MSIDYLPLILIIQNDQIQPWKEIGTQLLRYTVSLSLGLQLLTGVTTHYLFTACLDSLHTVILTAVTQ